ncbi:MAG: hypothetical protein GF393_05880 [Armatimonadia bacterium]|nr:hypothetical protein [Armatimonadia bacterium]
METGSEMIIEMLRRSYFAVDGLWFVMLEEQEGLERALQIDEDVWRVMPKIQARKARELIHADADTPGALARCMALKLAAEGHRYDVHFENSGHVEVVISRCPWREVLEQSEREHLGPDIADRICATEIAAWADEFSPEEGPQIVATMAESICDGDKCCRYVFRVSDDATPEE